MLDRTGWNPGSSDYRTLSPEQKYLFRQELIRRAHAQRAELMRRLIGKPFTALGKALAAGAVKLLAKWRADYAIARAKRDAVSRLMKLDDSTLKDIGVARSEIQSIVQLREQDETRRQREPRAA
jgi:uncharacterized protein YjiS (DUF1127 family)